MAQERLHRPVPMWGQDLLSVHTNLDTLRRRSHLVPCPFSKTWPTSWSPSQDLVLFQTLNRLVSDRERRRQLVP